MQTTEAPTSSRDPLSLPPVPPMARDAHSARDLLVSALFALALGVPGLALYDTAARTVTEFENRPAAPWPRWQELDAGSEFTTAFERAFADRFGTRNTLIRLHHAALAGVLQTSPASNVLLGRDGWLYFKGEDGKAVDRVFRRSPAPSAPEIAAIAGGITRRVNVLAGMDIDYLLVVVPDKYTIYPEFLPSWVRPLSDQSPLDATLAMLPAEVRAHVLDLRPALLAAKKQRQIYFRTDSHWNASGAWAGYQEILAAMRKNAGERAPPALPPERPGGMISGDLAKMLGVPSLFTEVDHSLVLGPGEGNCARTKSGEPPQWGAPRQTLFCATAPPATAAIFHDSMGIPLVSMLPNDFRESHWAQGRAWNLPELAAASPTIVIDEVVERNLSLLADTSFLGVAGAIAAGASGPLRWSRGWPPRFPENVRTTQNCALDQVNGSAPPEVFEIRARGTLDAEGWAADATRGALPGSIWMVLQQDERHLHVPVEAGRNRPDVAAATGKPALAKAGFRVVVSTETLPAGDYRMWMTWTDPSGWLACDLRHRLRLRAG